MTSEWRHVRTILMQNKGLKEPLSRTQFLSYKNSVAWNDVELIGLSNCYLEFSKMWKTNKIYEHFSEKNIFLILFNFSFVLKKNKINVIEPIKMNQCWQFQLNMTKMPDLYDIAFFCIRVWKMVIIQMHIFTCSRRGITKYKAPSEFWA